MFDLTKEEEEENSMLSLLHISCNSSLSLSTNGVTTISSTERPKTKPGDFGTAARWRATTKAIGHILLKRVNTTSSISVVSPN